MKGEGKRERKAEGRRGKGGETENTSLSGK